MPPAQTAAVVPALQDEGELPAYVREFLALTNYLTDTQREWLLHAWEVGAAAHAGQMRKSGEPYITHPVAVAGILAQQRLDVETLVAAILHDTIEDTSLTRDDLADQFGNTVAELVDGVTKLDKLSFGSRQEADAESFRKMMLAMARDLRVILIKLADRLHNMRTLGAQPGPSRTRIARETLDVYAPIAQRLGMNKIKAELQDLGFHALHPLRHLILDKHIRNQPLNRREALRKIEVNLAKRLNAEGLSYRLISRVKSPWSTYNKMRADGKTFAQVMDVFGIRIVLGRVSECYQALGVAHAAYKPLDGRVRDFIAIPKANGYQSLHTVLFGPYGAPIEVQIRTEEMDLIAERGIAAHWAYKHGDTPSKAQARVHSWIAGLLESQRTTGSSLEFLENVKVDLFPDDVYLFSPKGDILALPKRATALDFAYAVHTDIGNQSVAARVDRKLVPLRTVLTSGQTVEIITAKSALPKPQWLEFVVTGKARTAIRGQLKQLGHEDAVQLGHRMLDRALEDLGSSLERLPQQRLDDFVTELRYPRLEALLEDIALGNRMPGQVATALAQLDTGTHQVIERLPHRRGEKILITGQERGVISFAEDCHPIPGDAIMGWHMAGKGIVIHRLDCPEVAEFRRSPERWVAVDWDRQISGQFPVMLRVEAENRPGVLAQIAAAVAQAESNIEAVDYIERDSTISAIRFSIEVKSRKHLADVIRRVRRVQAVQGVQRM